MVEYKILYSEYQGALTDSINALAREGWRVHSYQVQGVVQYALLERQNVELKGHHGTTRYDKP